ncbi:hypothetical protein H9Q74_013503 [Fusarium xylarioides]|nr:hypothetical protein H9Q71_013323 [Fusarium xylarioides]KAG5811669.1 hypothetical protein H9Q74_013503 [Fusarium xylarioides]
MSRLYQPLDENSDEIRLLTLLPKSRKTGIPHCTLETYSLKAFTPQYLHFLSTSGVANLGKRRTRSQWIRSRIAPELAGLAPLNRIHSTQPPSSQYRFRWGDYAALSYVWGDENDTCIIILNEQPRRVTSNLAKALSAFLQDGEFEDGFKLWVDAICINQQDLGERARQLRRMRDIYGSAWAVIAWLGEASFRSSSAIQLIRDLSALSEASCGSQIEACLRGDPDYLGNGCWLAMHDLMKRPYWYRLWIIQEMIMGASVTWIRCGTVSIDWTSFCAGISFLEENLWLVKDELLIKERLAATSENGPACVYGDFNATAAALYRTLVLDRVAGGGKATARHAAILHLPRTFRRGAQEFTKRGWGWLAGQAGYYFRWEEFRSMNAGFDLGCHRLDDFFYDEIPQDASELDYSEVYSCFDRASQKRRFMTTTNGYMGWAPDNIFGEDSEQTRPGDLIAVLFGCSTPVVIRRYGPYGYYQVIGEAYVQGLMDGEAMELVDTGKLQCTRMTFC